MPYLPLTEHEGAPPQVQARYEQQLAQHGRITNMKRTLLHDLKAFDVYMEWYPLAEGCIEFIGERGLALYAYAISEGNRCLVCSTFFRKILIDSGDDPDCPLLSEEENLLMELGFSISEDPHCIDPEIYAQLKARYTTQQIVRLIAFAGMMAATNLFNTVAQVDLDEALSSYRRQRPWD